MHARMVAWVRLPTAWTVSSASRTENSPLLTFSLQKMQAGRMRIRLPLPLLYSSAPPQVFAFLSLR